MRKKRKYGYMSRCEFLIENIPFIMSEYNNVFITGKISQFYALLEIKIYKIQFVAYNNITLDFQSSEYVNEV